MPRCDAVVFDLDGTLLDTLDDLTDAVNHALGEMGWPLRARDEVRRFVGNGVVKLMERSVPAGTGPEDFDRAMGLFRAYYDAHKRDKTAPYPGVARVLAELRRRGIKTAVVSNKFDGAVKALMEDCFPGLLDAAAGENEAGGVPKKPHPAMVLETLKALGAAPERAVYVGDSDVDLDTAKNAGLPCIAVTWGFRDRDFLLDRGAEVLIDAPEELLELM